MILLFSTIPARAETIELKEGGRLTFREYGSPELTLDLILNIDRFLTDRRNIDYCNTLEKEMRQCAAALGASETRECENRAADDPPLFGSIGLPWIVTGAVALAVTGVAVGVVIGVELTKPRAVAIP